MTDKPTRQITNDIRYAIQLSTAAGLSESAVKVDNIHHEHDRSWFIIEHSTGHYTVEVSRREGGAA